MNNTSRFKVYGILAAALIVAAGVVWFYSGNHSSKVPSTKKSAASEQVKRTRPKSTAVADNASKRPKQTPNADRNDDGLIIIRKASGAYPTQHQGEIMMLNRKFGLQLTDEQLKDLTTKYSALAIERLVIEASYSQVVKTGENSYEVTIPAYEEGKKLRDNMANAIEQLLTSINKIQLAESVEVYLDRANNQWGTNPQQMTIDHDPNTNSYKIAHRSYDYLSSTTGTLAVEMAGEKMSESTVGEGYFTDYYYIIRKIRNNGNKF